MPDAATGLVVLLGNPVEHSLSPVIHNAAFAAADLNLTYLACRVEAGRLEEALDGLHALGGRGANVTIPHKQAALAHARTASESARAVGAANTLVRTGEGWHADNTDVEGFLAPLETYAEQIRGRTALILGAGGAARAVAWASRYRLQAGRVVVAARRVAQAQHLADDLGVEATTLEAATSIGADAALVVNATPVGMAPDVEATPWTWTPPCPDSQIAYDLVYRPQQTRFLREAEVCGATAIGGLPMLIGQAAAAYRLWTGRTMPQNAVRKALTSVVEP